MKTSAKPLKPQAPVTHRPGQMNGLRLDEERVGELLDIAAAEFLENGFAAASLSQIARKSRASKTTFYSRFPNKEQLFLAVMERLMTAGIVNIESSLDVSLAVEEGLRRHARVWLRLILAERQIAIARIAIMEAPRFPTFAKRFFELGPLRGQIMMAEYFKKKVLSGDLVDEDPETMSEHYLSLLLGGSIRSRQLQLRSPKLTSHELMRHVNGVIKVFLRAYGARYQESRSV